MNTLTPYKFALALQILCVSTTIAAPAQIQEKVLYSFGASETDASGPNSSLVADHAGNLYGTSGGGTYGGGTVFELSPNSDGSWSESVLYSFCYYYGNCPDGDYVSGLAIDASGNLYGTATYGGLDCTLQSPVGCGVAFELSPPGAEGGSWTYTVIYNFCSVGLYCEDGAGPVSSLIIDGSGNLYGTTFKGGQNQTAGNDAGVVFELSPGSGGWTESVLYSFCSVQQGGSCLDGEEPFGITRDSAGNIYGVTGYGGNPGSDGVLFKLSSGPNGWAETVLTQLVLWSRGNSYLGPLSIDPNGNLYTTYTTSLDRQRFAKGVVAKLNTRGRISEFSFNGSDGRGPIYGVLPDPKHRFLYGVTIGSSRGPGNAYQIDDAGVETVLYNFCQQSGCTDGSAPSGGFFEDQSGNLFSVTGQGGTYDGGVAYELTPSAPK